MAFQIRWKRDFNMIYVHENYSVSIIIYIFYLSICFIDPATAFKNKSKYFHFFIKACSEPTTINGEIIKLDGILKLSAYAIW